MKKIVLGIVVMAVLLGGLGAGFVIGYEYGHSNGCDEDIKEGFAYGCDFGVDVGMLSGYIDGLEEGGLWDKTEEESEELLDTLVEDYFKGKDPKWRAVYDDYVASLTKSVCSEAYIGSE